ncbi:MAG: GntR family transcriptional regulator [Comamonadaceae bacterium]|nr:GntR family transcriptional regulator [Comamonadaceae bacterium]
MADQDQDLEPDSAKDSRASQTIKAIMGLRGYIIDGRLRPGERVLEQMLVDTLGVSRTPARTAMQRVCEEGLMEPLPGGGFAVVKFSVNDVFDAIAVRGNLEGMAVRMAAERGAPPEVLKSLKKVVKQLDVAVENLKHSWDHLAEYVRLNDQFHDLMQDTCNSPMLKRSLERLVVLPFATPNAFASAAPLNLDGLLQVVIYAQEQHRSIVEAIELREGTRAEALAIEHSRSTWKYLHQIFLQGDSSLDLAGLRMIVRP